MDIPAEIQQKMGELQQFEQTLQHLTSQKHQTQLSLAETENALKELASSEEPAYKIIGNLMIKRNKKELIQELEEKQEILQLRIKTLDKQESQTKQKAEELQKEVMEQLK